MNAKEEFGLLMDAVLLAIENGLVEDEAQTRAALSNWHVRVANKQADLVPNWEAAPDWAKWFAVDKDGEAYYYSEKPDELEEQWGGPNLWLDENVAETSYTVEFWLNTLQERPKNVTRES